MTLETSYFAFTNTEGKTFKELGSDLNAEIQPTTEFVGAYHSDGVLVRHSRFQSDRTTASEVQQNSFDILVFTGSHGCNVGDYLLGQESGAEGEVLAVVDSKTLYLTAPTQIQSGEKCYIFDSKDSAVSFSSVPDDALIAHTDTADGVTYTCTGSAFKALFGTTASCGDSFSPISPAENELITLGRSTWNPILRSHLITYTWDILPTCPIYSDVESALNVEQFRTSDSGTQFYLGRKPVEWDSLVSFPSPAELRQPWCIGEETWQKEIKAGSDTMLWTYRVKCNDYEYDEALDGDKFEWKWDNQRAINLRYNGHQVVDKFLVTLVVKENMLEGRAMNHTNVNQCTFGHSNDIEENFVMNLTVEWVELLSSNPNYIPSNQVNKNFVIDRPYSSFDNWQPCTWV